LNNSRDHELTDTRAKVSLLQCFCSKLTWDELRTQVRT
jgi:hypothetical protein